MTEKSKELAVVPENIPAPASIFTGDFELSQRKAKALSESSLVPEAYRKNVPNCLIALEVAHRTGASILAVTQSLNIIHGRPSWSSQFIIAALNSCGRFAPIRFKVEVAGNDKICTAWTTDKHGEILEGPPVSISMAKAEGWYDKSGSKWKTMPDLMLRYRAAAFFGRLYAPDVLLGMHSEDEVGDMVDVTPQAPVAKAVASSLNEKIRGKRAEVIEPEVVNNQEVNNPEVDKEFF